MGIHKWNAFFVLALGCTVHNLTCTVQLKEEPGMGRVFVFACVGWWNTTQVRLLHRHV